MSEAEFLELITIVQDSGGFHSMNFVAALFAYIAVAYFAGSRLSGVQVLVLTALYTFFSVIPISMCVETFQRVQVLQIEFQKHHPEAAQIYLQDGGVVSAVYLIGVYGLAWLLSIVFMLSERYRARGT